MEDSQEFRVSMGEGRTGLPGLLLRLALVLSPVSRVGLSLYLSNGPECRDAFTEEALAALAPQEAEVE